MSIKTVKMVIVIMDLRWDTLVEAVSAHPNFNTSYRVLVLVRGGGHG